MEEHLFESIKQAVLDTIQELFAEREQELAVSHQEKYAVLEDLFENAVDVTELRVALEQWYADHATEVELDQGVDEIWDLAYAETV